MKQRNEKDYVLGTERAELERLGMQHQLWLAQAAEAWERAGFRPGQKLLDLGCGPGFATVDLAQRVGPRGQVVAVDIAERAVDHAEHSPLLRRRGRRVGGRPSTR